MLNDHDLFFRWLIGAVVILGIGVMFLVGTLAANDLNRGAQLRKECESRGGTYVFTKSKTLCLKSDSFI